MIVATDHDVVKDECHDIRMKSSKQFWLKYHASYLKESDFDLILELIINIIQIITMMQNRLSIRIFMIRKRTAGDN